MSKTFSTADVASHNKADDLYIIVDQDVYDLTKFQDEHPGGKKSMNERALCTCSILKSVCSSPARRWQGRVQAILEIPQ